MRQATGTTLGDRRPWAEQVKILSAENKICEWHRGGTGGGDRPNF
jgi:hypothetical protein